MKPPGRELRKKGAHGGNMVSPVKGASEASYPVMRLAPTYEFPYPDSLSEEIFTTSPVCGAWMN
jgi:hypothetical protein